MKMQVVIVAGFPVVKLEEELGGDDCTVCGAALPAKSPLLHICSSCFVEELAREFGLEGEKE